MSHLSSTSPVSSQVTPAPLPGAAPDSSRGQSANPAAPVPSTGEPPAAGTCEDYCAGLCVLADIIRERGRA